MDTCAEIELRQCKYLNNIIGQDHRAIKRVIRPMLGFKTFRCARIIIAGIEIMQMIRKGAAHAEGLQRDVVCRPVLRVGRTNPSCLRDRHSSQPEVRSSAANATQPVQVLFAEIRLARQGSPPAKNRRSSVPARRSAGVQVDRIKGRGATNEQPIELRPAETHVGHGFWDQDLPQQRAFARMAVHTVTGR